MDNNKFTIPQEVASGAYRIFTVVAWKSGNFEILLSKLEQPNWVIGTVHDVVIAYDLNTLCGVIKYICDNETILAESIVQILFGELEKQF
jgi:pyruvate kinase